jgi:hypothetical protein
MNNRRERRALALWAGLGSGLLLVLASSLMRHWPFPGSSTSAVVYPPDPSSMSAEVRLAFLLAGSALIAAGAAYAAASAMDRPPAQRVQLPLLFALVAAAAAGAYVYLMYHPGADWWFVTTTTTTDAPGELARVIFPAAGVLLGLGTALVFRVPSVMRVLAMTLMFGLGGALAAYVSIPVAYLLGGAMVDLSEGLGIGALPGAIVGSFLAGYLTGWVSGMTAGFSVPSPAIEGPVS